MATSKSADDKYLLPITVHASTDREKDTTTYLMRVHCRDGHLAIKLPVRIPPTLASPTRSSLPYTRADTLDLLIKALTMLAAKEALAA